ncbi:phosphatidylglycerol:prolipoprotein diacylglycerol transferase [Sporomusaceae bacterium BoRhaA]|uniref:prolipoprotein diacylglyceryl transferase n=1 Tax=Pelorhabdus rhamnosifermentans TaxID=2772457 RepID=UPI001C063096|nr:prolipoprotein diacylglyceryl transferase [Pelorhabdus rhamnosifermentans]MBU2702999.1 phosphatidylglycerol:prolipoprotein diacylglycerol transferase [Pelorhabdus rhamnosifermentans]
MNYGSLVVGPWHFHWYGLIMSGAILCCILTCYCQILYRRLPVQPLLDMAVLAIPAGILGARLYYVIINWPYYSYHLGEIFCFSQGGFAMHGAMLGVILVLVGYAKYHSLPFGLYADAVAPGLALGQSLGQWANLVNQEAIGYPTYLSWGIYIDYAHRPVGYEEYDFFHPVFMYQSGADFGVFLILLVVGWLFRNRFGLKSGWLFFLYLILQSIGRIIVEFTRLDGEILYGVNIAQLGSLIFIVVASILLILRQRNYSNLWRKRQ